MLGPRPGALTPDLAMVSRHAVFTCQSNATTHVTQWTNRNTDKKMTENKAPGDAPNASTTTADQPGRPYYEQLRTTLRGTLDKKRKLDEQLAALEEQIFKVEGAYLEETSNSGNIVRGFDGWVKGVSVGGRGADDRRRGRIRDEDRVFSRSSVGWMRVRSVHLEDICAVLLLTILNRRKKARTRTHRRMQLRLPALSMHPYLAQRVLRAPLERPGTRRKEPPKKTMMMRRRQSAGRLPTRGTERNGDLLQERSEHGVRRYKEYQDLGTVDFWVVERVARKTNSIKPYASTSKQTAKTSAFFQVEPKDIACEINYLARRASTSRKQKQEITTLLGDPITCAHFQREANRPV
jgi:hypothetical protein